MSTQSPRTQRQRLPRAGLFCVLLLCAWPVRSAEADADADAERGRLLISRYHCGSCHEIPGVPDAKGALAQPLTAYGRRSYIAGRLPNNAQMRARWLADPPALVPGTRMPNLGVAPQDARDMAAWLGLQR